MNAKWKKIYERSSPEQKDAFDNPWRCPSCEVRFPTKEKMDEHWEQNNTCYKYSLYGIALIESIRYNGADGKWGEHFDDWKREQPKKLFMKGLEGIKDED